MKMDKLLEEMSLEQPSTSFADNLMHQIEREVVRQKRHSQWLSVASLAAGVTGICAIPASVYYIGAQFFPDLNFNIAFPKIEFSINPMIAMAGLSVLILLLGDMLLRKKFC